MYWSYNYMRYYLSIFVRYHWCNLQAGYTFCEILFFGCQHTISYVAMYLYIETMYPPPRNCFLAFQHSPPFGVLKMLQYSTLMVVYSMKLDIVGT